MDKLRDAFIYDTIDSTMDMAIRLIQKGERIEEGAFIFARKQEASRGRRGRVWQSISGNCHVSFFIEVRQKDPPLQTLSFLSALVLRDAIMPYARSADAIRFKWPNDVLWNGQKVGGILLERAPFSSGGKEWMILGVGLNLVDYPSQTPYPVTSIRAFSGHVVRPLRMIEKIRH
ncbi:MAG: biotin--[acetyl-CoA-carboxylase] ligase, partial [Alphaproteobacteria bacterium]|nr:biotin--[acetyl-CoA-carboxylase] ligase [Alphaproteobacteria bacterium]